MKEKYPVSGFTRDKEAIYVNGIRIFVPVEHDKFKAGIPKKRHKTLFELSTITGMRYAEIQRLYDHPEWYSESRNQIRLNEDAQKKVKRKAKERTIDLLPSTFPYILDQFFNWPAPPDIDTWNQDLKRWAVKTDFNPFGISAKTTRKSIESWMLSSGVPPFKVYQRQGHDPQTSLYHYQGLSFTDIEMHQIKKRLMEWGILKTDT
ncbi:site-specific integrase [Methanosarcina sp. DH1]|uniref:site-specific integrase n=1 Tax=Methanosarcina sp. DH1 TaxID=2605695 RepID=UPI001E594ECC|nr:site-specific integrase [Methanosarcina sp. DH1]MCC4767614.1 site-specific integrase [Methanosarcina sp. DH1]